MAATIVPDLTDTAAWERMQARAFELFCESRALNVDDALLAALVEAHAPTLCQRALALLDAGTGFNFAHAFRAVRTTDRMFADDTEPLPFDATPARLAA